MHILIFLATTEANSVLTSDSICHYQINNTELELQGTRNSLVECLDVKLYRFTIRYKYHISSQNSYMFRHCIQLGRSTCWCKTIEIHA